MDLIIGGMPAINSHLTNKEGLLWCGKKKTTIHKQIGPWIAPGHKKKWLHWEHKPEAILNQRIVILAPPRSGKTYLVKSLLLGALQTHHPLIINVAPAPTLGEEQDNFLPNICYFSWDEFINNSILDQLVIFQQERMRHYRYLHRGEQSLEAWRRLIVKIDKIIPGELVYYGKCIVRDGEHELKLAGSNEHTINKVCTKFQKKIQEYYTYIILRYRRQLMESNLFNSIEFGALSVVGIEPHVIIVFDDMGETLKGWTPLSNLWIKQRHFNIGLVIIGHALKRQIPTTIRSNTSIWITHGSAIFTTMVNEHLVPQGPDKNAIMHNLGIADVPRKFMVFGEEVGQNNIYITESEYSSNQSAYPFLKEAEENELQRQRERAQYSHDFILLFQRIWNMQFLYAHKHYAKIGQSGIIKYQQIHQKK